MIFLTIPVGTDAPIYHRPFATIGLMVANVLGFLVTHGGSGKLLDSWVLEFGTINPLQWLSSMFAHAGFGHLFFNMLFLFIWGVIVEGKIGWMRMLIVYLLIGISQAALIQGIMLASEGGALGASSAIFGLMAICLVWAPKNEITFWYFFWMLLMIRTGAKEITIMTCSILYLSLDFISWALIHKGEMSTAALHLSGALIGFGVGVFMLKKDMVDCEKWDLFRVMSGNYGRFASSDTDVGSHANPAIMFGTKDVSVKEDIKDESHKTKNRRLQDSINAAIDSGDFITASEKMLDLRMKDSGARLTEQRLKQLAKGLVKAEMPDDAEIYLEEYIEGYPDECEWARLALAKLLYSQERPTAALTMLKKIRVSKLTANQLSFAKKIGGRCKKDIANGVQDAEPEW